MKDIRFGSIPQKYIDREGKEKTSWMDAGYKLVIDWQEEKVFMIDARTGGMVLFNKKPETTQSKPEVITEDEIQF